MGEGISGSVSRRLREDQFKVGLPDSCLFCSVAGGVMWTNRSNTVCGNYYRRVVVWDDRRFLRWLLRKMFALILYFQVSFEIFHFCFH